MTVTYPLDYDFDIVLRDGSTIHLRPIRPEDAPKLMDLYGRLSPECLRFRFFTIPKPDPARAEALARVDYVNEFALVAELGDRVEGVARYVRDERSPDRAEAAFVIADALQGRGVGTQMLERLADIARERGIKTFDAYALADNIRMMDVFLNSGFEVTRRLDGGVYHVALSLEPTPALEVRVSERARKAAAASMRVFFEPRVVAVVGANRGRGRIGGEIFHNLRAAGFRGTVVPVNPHAGEIDGVPAVARVGDIPGPVDVAIVTVPAPHVDQVVDDCIAKGVKGLVVITAGFGETGAEGRHHEAALLAKVRAAGVRMIGPNCMGLINTADEVRLNGTFAPVYPPGGTVALSSQSGALGLAILDYARRLNIGISTFVSIGNKADVSSNDLVQYWAEDPRTSVILLYLESFGNPANFTRIARHVSREKPIVAVKAGRSEAGARAASSHTGALAARDAVVDALFRQAGVIRVYTLEELFDVAGFLAHQPVPGGRRVAILTNAGGPAILAADACESHGLELPPLGDATVAELRSFLPAAASVANPVDMLASAPASAYRRAIRAIVADPAIDSLMVIFIPPLVTDPAEVATAIVDGAAESAGKPVVATFMSAEGTPPILSPIPCYVFPESAAVALARVAAYGEWKRREPGSSPSFDDVQEKVARGIVDAALARGGGWLTPDEAQDLLHAFGIPVAKARIAGAEEEAIAAAREIGYPVALKAVGPAILHKTEVGGLRLGLQDEAALRAAYGDLSGRLGDRMTGALVQAMVPGGVEMVVGSIQDPTFGPLIVCGSGGTLVELLADVAFRLHPLTDRDAAEMLEEIRGVALLRGYRGATPGDEDALRDVLLRVSRLIDCCPEVHEMDLNPLKVLARGVAAVDVRIRVAAKAGPVRAGRIAY